MSQHAVRLLAENLPDQRFLEAIFRPQIDQGLLKVDSGLTTSGAISIAEFSLLKDPDQPVALVLNTHTSDEEKIADLLGSVRRILSRTVSSNWHVALAIPRLDQWAMKDPAVKAAFDSSPATSKNHNSLYVDRAVRMADLVRKKPFDRAILARESVQFRALEEFITSHVGASRATNSVLGF
jgi:hypothetical protein